MISNLRIAVLVQSCFLAYQTVSNNLITQNRAEEEKKHLKAKLTKSYIWGNGQYIPRHNTSMQFRNFEPKLIKSFLGEKNLNFIELNFGEHHEGGIDLKGNFYIWPKHRLDATIPHTDDDEVRAGVIQLDDSKNVKQICFSKGWAWALNNNGEVYQWIIKTFGDEENDGDDRNLQFQINPKGKKVEVLKNISQIATGVDHFVALDRDGNVWTMGDDTFGQCGIGLNRRNTAPPFFETRVRNPVKIPHLTGIRKISCGSNHTLAITEEGVVYGWGSNSNLQLSHEQEFAAPENPLLAVFSPLRLEKNLSNSVATDIAGGEEHTVIVTKHRFNGETEVFGCGKNLVGQLGIGTLSHVHDIAKIESLSNYRIKDKEGEKNVTIKQISCGNNHCMALLSPGVVLEWGANEYGELGNRKRTFTEHPIIVSDIVDEEVLNISARYRNSSVITEFNAELERLKLAKQKKSKFTDKFK